MKHVDVIERLQRIRQFYRDTIEDYTAVEVINMAIEAVEKQEADGWIPVTERLPEVNRDVLLSSNMGNVYAGHRDTTDFIYKVTDKNGRELWVYDPEAYTDDIDSLPKTEDCSFDNDECTQGWLSVSSANYNDRFEGITAWRPLPEPYTEEEA